MRGGVGSSGVEEELEEDDEELAGAALESAVGKGKGSLPAGLGGMGLVVESAGASGVSPGKANLSATGGGGVELGEGAGIFFGGDAGGGGEGWRRGGVGLGVGAGRGSRKGGEEEEEGEAGWCSLLGHGLCAEEKLMDLTLNLRIRVKG